MKRGEHNIHVYIHKYTHPTIDWIGSIVYIYIQIFDMVLIYEQVALSTDDGKYVHSIMFR